MKPEGLTALICSVDFEAGLVLGSLQGKRTVSPGLYTGELGGSPVALMASGMGMANAAHAATVLALKYSPARVICFGIGGAYPGSGLDVGDVVFAGKEVYADTGVLTPNGLRGIEATGMDMLRRGRKKFYNEFPLDAALLRAAGRHLDNMTTGTFLTVCAVTGTGARARSLRKKWSALCENMEGAAVAHVCARYGVPAMELRGISNAVGVRDSRKWKKEAAAEAAQETLLSLLR